MRTKLSEEFRSHLVGQVAKGERVLLRWALGSEYQRGDDFDTVTISTGQVDRYHTILNPEGWDTKAYRKNPVVLWAHFRSELPIGNSVKEYIEGAKLKSDMQWVPADMNPWAAIVRRFYEEKYLRAWSVGFIPTKIVEPESMDEPLRFEENELVEYSAVPVPANPGALSEGMVPEEYEEQGKALMRTMSVAYAQVGSNVWRPVPKGAIEGLAPAVVDHPEKVWDAIAAQQRVAEWAGGDAAKRAKAYAVINGSELVFPHHDVEGGSLVTIKRGVELALEALLAPGIPDAVVVAAYAHLAEHAAQFSVAAKTLDEVMAARKGAVLRQSNLEKLVMARDMLDEVIETAQKPDDDDDEDEGDEGDEGSKKVAPLVPNPDPAPEPGAEGEGIEAVEVDEDDVEVEGVEVEE
jgi:hypothetical protein